MTERSAANVDGSDEPAKEDRAPGVIRDFPFGTLVDAELLALQTRIESRIPELAAFVTRYSLDQQAAVGALLGAAREGVWQAVLQGSFKKPIAQQLLRIEQAAEKLLQSFDDASPGVLDFLEFNGLGLPEDRGVRPMLPAIAPIIRSVAAAAAISRQNYNPLKNKTRQVPPHSATFIYRMARQWSTELRQGAPRPSVSSRQVGGHDKHGANEGARFILEAHALVYDEELPLRTLQKILRRWAKDQLGS